MLWDNSGTPDDSFVTRPAQVEVKGLAIQQPVWVDLVSGRIYEIPADRIQHRRIDGIQGHSPLRRPGADCPARGIRSELMPFHDSWKNRGRRTPSAHTSSSS